MIGIGYIAMCACLATPVVDFQRAYRDALDGSPNAVVQAQRAMNVLMGWQAESPSGVIAMGKNVRVVDLSPARIQRDARTTAPIARAMRLSGTGPTLRVYVPLDDDAEHEVYWRESAGLYVRLENAVRQDGRWLTFKAPFPGEYVVREKDAYSDPAGDPPPFLDFIPPSSAPEAKALWRFYRAEPTRVAGPTPLILLHGMGNDRWKDFFHWAANSPEAEAFRARFQLWNYQQPISGVNAAIGFSRAYPGFEESIVAYLARFLQQAAQEGVETDGVRYYFPSSGPMAILTHSQGGLKARAFLLNYSEYADRVFAVAALSAPLTGSPWGTPQWLRHTINRTGFSGGAMLGSAAKTVLSDIVLTGYFSTARQSDLDMGWGNFDAAGGFGFPFAHFTSRRFLQGTVRLTLSPRDANQTGARQWPGIADASFDPPELLDTYCGGLDVVMPALRGGGHMDKFFLYGAYLDPALQNGAALREGRHTVGNRATARRERFENIGLRMTARLMGKVLCEGSDIPLGVFGLNDGFVPLQSQLMLDGSQTELIYCTREINGWRAPVSPYRLREDIIASHTLADPARLRIMPGYSHLDMTTGRYNARTGHSELFLRVAEDLLAAESCAANGRS